MSEKISNLKISDNKISLHYDGQDISYQIKIVPHEMWVASWDFYNPTIFFDKNLQRQYRTPMAIHEAIEKYVCERYGLNEHDEGHRIAEYIEEEWFVKTFGKKKLYDYNHEYDKIQRNEWFSFLKKHKFKHEKGHVFKV